MDTLPAELLHEIASHDVYREMLSIPLFARSLTISVRLDYMIAMGYDVIIEHDRTKWSKNNKAYRTDGPAIEYVSGDKMWYVNGLLHRADGPAVEWADGYKEWWVNGKLHREDGPAIERIDGTKRWYINGKLVAPQS